MSYTYSTNKAWFPGCMPYDTSNTRRVYSNSNNKQNRNNCNIRFYMSDAMCLFQCVRFSMSVSVCPFQRYNFHMSVNMLLGTISNVHTLTASPHRQSLHYIQSHNGLIAVQYPYIRLQHVVVPSTLHSDTNNSITMQLKINIW